MASILKVDTIQDQSGNNIINENAGTITIGKSGDIINLASGATAGFGKVNQIVTGSTTTAVTVTTTVRTEIGLEATITPSSTSSKILVMAEVMAKAERDIASNWTFLYVYRDDTGALYTVAGGQANSTDFETRVPMTYLDSPSSTSALRYNIRGRPYVTSNNGQVIYQRNSYLSNITLMEILP